MKSCAIEFVDIAIPCSWNSPGPKEWDYGEDCYVQTVRYFVPAKLADRAEDDDLLLWIENNYWKYYANSQQSIEAIGMISISELEEQSFERLLAEVGPVKLWATFASNVEAIYTVEKDEACAYEGENIHKAVQKFNELTMISVSELEEQRFSRLLAGVGPFRFWATFAPNISTVYSVENQDGVFVYKGENIHKAVQEFNEIAGAFEVTG